MARHANLNVVAPIMALALVAGCSSPDMPTLATSLPLVVSGPVVTANIASGVFRNPTGFVLELGNIGCTATIEKQVGFDWTPVGDDRVCRAFGRQVSAGDTLAFTFQAPTEPGIYRLRGNASIVYDDPPGQSTMPAGSVGLQSLPFAVIKGAPSQYASP